MKPGRLETYSDLEIALMILLGVFGNGQDRKNALGSRYGSCQAIVDYILNNNEIPAGNGNADPEKLSAAIEAVFEDTLKELNEEIMNKYEN